jgi:acyl carrier protein
LHDDWSPYKHFTVVPFFPYFRRGQTIGTVESLLDPQELLNKVSSQELHVVNTTANSGWKIKTSSLQNMSIAEVEARGAQTGLVLELEDVGDAEKILPNQVPTGLERISWKAEEHIKTISMRPDYSAGFAREDVSDKALQRNQAAAAGNYVAVQDSLQRTDHLLARALLDLVQTYYTEERLMFITTDPLRQTTEELKINEVTPEGEIVNDLTLGEYDIVVTSQPERDTLEDSTFEQIVELRKELGIEIPDSVFIQTSRLPDKSMVIDAIEAQTNGPEAQAQRQLDHDRQLAEVRQINAGAGRDEADTASKQVRTAQDAVNLQRPIDPAVQLRVEADLAKSKYETDTDAMVKIEIARMNLRANPPKQEKTNAEKGTGKDSGRTSRRAKSAG